MGAVTVVVVKLETSGGIHGWIFLSLYSLDRISFHGTRRLLFNPPFSLAFSLRHVTLVFFFFILCVRVSLLLLSSNKDSLTQKTEFDSVACELYQSFWILDNYISRKSNL